MRTTSYRSFTTSLLLVGAMLLLSGCGDPGAHLPASMSGGAASAGMSGGGILGGDPGPVSPGVSTAVDDPVLAGYDGIDSVSSLSSDDPFTHAVNDWNETEGTYSAALLDDAPLPDLVDYGYGYDDGYGYGGLALAGYGTGGILSNAIGGWGGVGLMDAGLLDGGFEDPALFDEGLDAGGFANVAFDGFDPIFEGPSGVDMLDDGGFDPGFVDGGFIDAGFADGGFVDPGFDAGAADVGFVDAGFDGGFVDAGFADFGGGFDF